MSVLSHFALQQRCHQLPYLAAFELYYRAEKFIEEKTVKMRKQNNQLEGKQKFYFIFKLYSSISKAGKTAC